MDKSKKTLKVAVTGAAGNIAYSLIPMLANGDVFGPDVSVHISMLDLPDCEVLMKGVAMELEDCAFPLLAGIEYGTDPKKMLKDVDVAILLGGKIRTPGMERIDLLEVNATIFKEHGQALEEVGKPDCKVLVVVNPCNTMCYILMQHCTKIPRKNFTALMRLDHNRLVGQLATKFNTTPDKVSNVVVWGNHSLTQYPDVSYAKVDGVSVLEKKSEVEFLRGDMITTIQKRGGAVLHLKKRSTVLSGAIAARDHLRNWYQGTKEGDWVSMAVWMDGKSYDLPEGLVCSVPVRCKNFEWEIVQGLEIDEFSIQESVNELLQEKEEADSIM
eukprot:CAMPEP_0176452932 /NCGR_PEP_ID=MMETSP0127-20121128/28885_1 /TAXON_ID=938130 /ORGANISM="Platyophrya macrostoma, Strain WH" /LENGTH=327 /DNA_ID=CAMNT_0017841591 /DNA_START=47 /DNA_END=1030 /DNA_ORIENTATION=+